MSPKLSHKLVCHVYSPQYSRYHAEIVLPAQEPLSAIVKAEAENFEELRYRWLTHASRLCDRRRRGDSDAPVVAFLDIWAIEHHKRKGEILQAEAAGACRVIDPLCLPPPFVQLRSGAGGFTVGSGGYKFECGPHSFRRHSVTTVDSVTEGNAKSGARGNIIGDQSRAVTTSNNIHGETRYTEAEELETRGPSDIHGSRHRAPTPSLAVRQVRIRNGRCTDTDCLSRSRNERVDSQTACCRNSSRGRRSAAKSASTDRQRLVVGQVCCGCHRKEERGSGGSPNSCYRHCKFCAARSSEAWPSDRSYDGTHSTTSIECSTDTGFRGETCASVRAADFESTVPVPRKHSVCCKKYTYTHDDTNPDRRATRSECDGCTSPHNTSSPSADTCKRAYSPQSDAACAISPNRESPLELDGTSEEVKTNQPRALERRRTRAERAPSQVASRIRELELMNAMPMPRHFRPAGHTRHDNDNRSHRSQLHRDEKPNVDLIFPLHVRRFPRRTSDGSPFRPGIPLHHSIPEEEPYIHAPQPSRSMPMLKDPPESERQSTPKPQILDTSRGNQDGFAIASGYGRRESRNFAVRRNSRP